MRTTKQAICESRLDHQPIAPCEMIADGLAGNITINEIEYAISILGYLPEVGEPVVQGYRFTKSTGECYDVCLVNGRLECSCGDWTWRRSNIRHDSTLSCCKHCKAVRQHLQQPIDLRPQQTIRPQRYATVFDDP